MFGQDLESQLRSLFGRKTTKKICNKQVKMKVFSNKREKLCVFFKSRREKVTLLAFIPYIIYKTFP